MRTEDKEKKPTLLKSVLIPQKSFALFLRDNSFYSLLVRVV